MVVKRNISPKRSPPCPHYQAQRHDNSRKSMQNNVNPISGVKQISIVEKEEKNDSNNQPKKSPQMKSPQRSKIIVRENGRRFKNGIELFYEPDGDGSNDITRKEPKSPKSSASDKKTGERSKDKSSRSDTSSSAASSAEKAPANISVPETIEYRREKLQSAIQTGDNRTVKKLIKQDPKLLGYADKQAISLLFIAVECGKYDIATDLIEAGVSLDFQNASVCQTLTLAITKGETKLAQIMIEKAVGFDPKNDIAANALHRAVNHHQTDIVALLLDKGVSANVKRSKGATPLIKATRNRDEKMASLLISRGASVDDKDDYGSAALIHAAVGGSEKIVQLLLEHGASANTINDEGKTALHFAALYGNTHMASLLIERGANVNQIGPFGLTPLMIASASGKKEIIELLLQYKADTELTDINNDKALMFACEHGHLEIVKRLLESNKTFSPSISSFFKFDETPQEQLIEQRRALYLAAVNGHAEIVDLLIKKLKLIPFSNKMVKKNFIPETLSLSIANGETTIIPVLMKHGAILDPLKKYLWRKIKNAAANGHTKTIQLIFENFSPSLQEKLANPAEDDATKIQQQLQDALIKAVVSGHHETANLLVIFGAIPSLRKENGQSAFDIAIQKSDIRLINALLAKNVTLSKLSPSSRASNELLIALGHRPPNPLIVDALIQFENDSAEKQGIKPKKLTFDAMWPKILELIKNHQKEKLDDDGLYRATTALLCTEFAVFYRVAEAIASAVKDMASIFPVGGRNQADPSGAQLRAGLAEAIASSPFLHELKLREAKSSASPYENYAQAPETAKSLVQRVISQANLLTDIAEKESDEYWKTLNGFLKTLSPITSHQQMRSFMNETGWHPLIVTLISECWEHLAQKKTPAALIKAIQSEFRSTELAEKVERLSEASRHLLIMQMNRLSKIDDN